MSVDFTLNQNQIIVSAMELCGALAPSDSLQSSDAKTAIRHLNMMIKSWQGHMNIWTRSQATVFLQKGQIEYTLGPDGDNATESYILTSIDIAGSMGDAAIQVTSSLSLHVGDYIGIELDTGYLQWTTIASILGAVITLAAPLTASTSSANYVYVYTTKMTRPIQIWSVRRWYAPGTEIPLNQEAYNDYFDFPSKNILAIPTSYMFSPKLTDSKLYVWSAPSDVKNVLKISYSRQINNMTNALDDPDMPQEWLEAITWNLAVRLCHVFRKAGGMAADSYANLVAMAQDMLLEAQSVNVEYASMYLSPDTRRY